VEILSLKSIGFLVIFTARVFLLLYEATERLPVEKARRGFWLKFLLAVSPVIGAVLWLILLCWENRANFR
jgi:hypothetical protein